MVVIFSRLATYTIKYPITRGMITYGILWPTSNLMNQTFFVGRNYTNYDYTEALRFLLWGSLFVAPTLYCWMRLSSILIPKTNYKTSIIKALLEQVTYSPFAITCFFFGMAILKGEGIKRAKQEVEDKFFTTYQVSICVWPVIQTINFTWIPERNRVPFVSACSFMWSCFLSYMHELQKSNSHKNGCTD